MQYWIALALCVLVVPASSMNISTTLLRSPPLVCHSTHPCRLRRLQPAAPNPVMECQTSEGWQATQPLQMTSPRHQLDLGDLGVAGSPVMLYWLATGLLQTSGMCGMIPAVQAYMACELLSQGHLHVQQANYRCSFMPGCSCNAENVLWNADWDACHVTVANVTLKPSQHAAASQQYNRHVAGLDKAFMCGAEGERYRRAIASRIWGTVLPTAFAVWFLYLAIDEWRDVVVAAVCWIVVRTVAGAVWLAQGVWGAVHKMGAAVRGVGLYIGSAIVGFGARLANTCTTGYNHIAACLASCLPAPGAPGKCAPFKNALYAAASPVCAGCWWLVQSLASCVAQGVMYALGGIWRGLCAVARACAIFGSGCTLLFSKIGKFLAKHKAQMLEACNICWNLLLAAALIALQCYDIVADWLLVFDLAKAGNIQAVIVIGWVLLGSNLAAFLLSRILPLVVYQFVWRRSQNELSLAGPEEPYIGIYPGYPEHTWVKRGGSWLVCIYPLYTVFAVVMPAVATSRLQAHGHDVLLGDAYFLATLFVGFSAYAALVSLMNSVGIVLTSAQTALTGFGDGIHERRMLGVMRRNWLLYTSKRKADKCFKLTTMVVLAFVFFLLEDVPQAAVQSIKWQNGSALVPTTSYARSAFTSAASIGVTVARLVMFFVVLIAKGGWDRGWSWREDRADPSWAIKTHFLVVFRSLRMDILHIQSMFETQGVLSAFTAPDAEKLRRFCSSLPGLLEETQQACDAIPDNPGVVAAQAQSGELMELVSRLGACLEDTAHTLNQLAVTASKAQRPGAYVSNLVVDAWVDGVQAASLQLQDLADALLATAVNGFHLVQRPPHSTLEQGQEHLALEVVSEGDDQAVAVD